MSIGPVQLSPDELPELARVLGDSPETAIPANRLMRGACSALVVGQPARFKAAVIMSHDNPGEPDGFGEDPEALWSILAPLEGWRVVDVSPSVAPKLGAVIRASTGSKVAYYGDVYHTLTRPAVGDFHPDVRLLTVDDRALFDGVTDDLKPGMRGDVEIVLREGFVAGAVVDDRLVSVAHTNAITERYADIGVFTHEDFRNRGYSTAAASIVASAIQKSGRTPVWSCGEDNLASLRVAAKVGFTEVSRRTYVIPFNRVQS
ncbi:MAG: GNAT family N-acetyltransferase [Dehalococcoidia bacterium]|nr:GNAT family N-acetyltransferase [Dehalococcoidia bacterium]